MDKHLTKSDKWYDPAIYSERSERRAKDGTFTFEVRDDGFIEVRNEEKGSNYLITLDGRLTDGCTCEAAKYFDEVCKHQRAVLDTPEIVLAAHETTEQFGKPKASDGGNDLHECHSDEFSDWCNGPIENEDGVSCFECFIRWKDHLENIERDT